MYVCIFTNIFNFYMPVWICIHTHTQTCSNLCQNAQKELTPKHWALERQRTVGMVRPSSPIDALLNAVLPHPDPVALSKSSDLAQRACAR